MLFTQGSSARLTESTKDSPVDAVIIGIVDTVEMGGQRSRAVTSRPREAVEGCGTTRTRS